jgi:NDP-sugar pyrophosphorylase family protein
MRPLTFSMPKPLLPFGDKPIIEHSIERLKSHGATEVFISVGYMAELIQAYCRDGSQWGLRIEYLHESKPLGTAGPLAFLCGRLDRGESLILMNGDIVTNLDFADLMRSHNASGAAVTMAYAKITTRSAFGVLDVKDGKVVSVEEKPEMSQLVNAGIYAIHERALELIPDKEYFTMPDLVNKLMSLGDDVSAFAINGYWRGLETREDIDAALLYLNELST